MGKKLAILQSNYIPWKGYFDLIASVDEFVLFDDMQFTRRDWRNRNYIKTSSGLQRLTVPVKVKGNYHQKICETQIDGQSWALSHWKAIVLNYKKSQFFDEISDLLEPLYLSRKFEFLSELNRELISTVCGYLRITTCITSSSDYVLADERSERLVSICQQAGATEYVSGPAAKAYMDETLFNDAGISVRWFDYSGYRAYPQLWGEFVHSVTILDLLFNCGPQSFEFVRRSTIEPD